MRKCLFLVVLLAFFGSSSVATALDSYYYNKVPYDALFAQKVVQKKVQKTDGKGKVVQAVIPVDEGDKTQEKGD